MQTPTKYKYTPDDFTHLPSLYDELAKFYCLLETYKAEKTKSAWLDLKYHWWENLFFTIKHREVEGSLSPVDAAEIRDYLEGLLYDD